MQTAVTDPAHLVQFYEGEDYLYRVVADFLELGLEGRVPMVVIATAPHRRAFVKALEQRGHDVAAAQATGLLTMLDARETLAKFMVHGMPDAALFSEHVGAAIEAAIAKSPAGLIRAYGEMVDLLWRDENPRAAIALEELWNALAAQHTFTLLCAYGLGGFAKSSDTPGFEQVCRTHSHVRPTERYPAAADSDTRLREISLLEQRAKALEHELVARDRSEQNLSDFLENAAEGIHAVGPDGTILWANRAELELLGYTKDEYVGHHISEFHVDLPLLDELLLRLGNNETLTHQEARMRCRDGSVKDVLIHSNALVRDGSLVHTRCFTRDVTEKRRLERELKAQNEELAAKVRFADQFVNMLGHDLRNPLSAITTAAGLLRRRGGGDKVTRPAERILSSAERMSCMVDQLLDFARARLGDGIPIERGASDLAEVCRMVLEEQTTQRTDLNAIGDATGEWDSEKLAHLVSTLLGNALTHGEPGGPIALEVDGSHPRRVTLSIHNRGTIPSAFLAQLFEARDTRQHGANGLGLGLYICREIARAHGGTLEVTSTDALGTRFTLTLPRKG